jgi:hypothetical protein
MSSRGKETLVGASAPFCGCAALGEKREGNGGGPVRAAPRGGKRSTRMRVWSRPAGDSAGRAATARPRNVRAAQGSLTRGT